MTYKGLQNILKIMLIGDNVIPQNPEILLSALEMAYIEIANQCTALKLLTANQGEQIIREGLSGSYVRMPTLPKIDTDELDIDSELAPAVARIMASYITKDKIQQHLTIAERIMGQYESKVRGFILSQEQRGIYTDTSTDVVISSDGSGTIALATTDTVVEGDIYA